MKLKILVTAGDGIGPEVTNEAVAVLKEVAALGGHDFTFDCKAHRRRRHRAGRHAAARRHAGRRARLRRGSAWRSRRQRVQFPAPRQAPRGRPAADSRGARRLRQSAPCVRVQGAHGQQPAAARDRRRRRHPVRPRTARRPLLRQAPRVEQGKRRRLQHHALHARRSGPRGPHRLPAGAEAPQETDQRRQGQRA